MNARVKELFSEVADLSPQARTQYLAEHEVDEDIRREVRALLAFDSDPNSFLLQTSVLPQAAPFSISISRARARAAGPTGCWSWSGAAVWARCISPSARTVK
jgi:hypothetical protein